MVSNKKTKEKRKNKRKTKKKKNKKRRKKNKKKRTTPFFIWKKIDIDHLRYRDQELHDIHDV